LSKNKGIILELTLQISVVACQLDSAGSVQRHSDGTTVPATAMLSVRDSEIATQTIFPQFEQCSCSLLHTILCRSQRPLCCCCVAKGRTSDRDRLAMWCYQFGDDIDRKSSTVKTAGTLRLCCVFCNSMEYSAACNAFIVENTQSYEPNWFSVKITAVALVNTMVLDLGMGLGLSKSNAIFVYTLLQIIKYKNTL